MELVCVLYRICGYEIEDDKKKIIDFVCLFNLFVIIFE